MEKKGFTRKISEYIIGLKEKDIPDSSYGQAKVAFMDLIAVALAGMNEPLVHKLLHHVDIVGGHEQVTILGHHKKVNVTQGALVNGAMSHALDYDDSLPVFMGHPSTVLFPGLMALAEWKNLSGKDFLTAYVIGIQTGCWIGRCAGVDHYLTGWHGTSTIGRLASAAAGARLLGLDEVQTTHALGIAATQTCGLKRVFGTMCKPFHAGAAAQGGITAVMLAADGFDSAKDIFEGPDGFFQLFKGNPDEGGDDFLGNTHDIDGLAQKFHASCHGTHSPIEVILGIVKESNPDPTEIESITICCSQSAVDIAGKTSPETGLDGKFSISYCVANALIRKDTGISAFTDEKVNDPVIKNMMEKISVIVDDEHRDAGFRCTGEVKTIGGNTYSKTFDILADIPELETKREKTAVKFDGMCVPVLGEEKAMHLKKAVENIDEAESLEEIILLSAVN